MVGSSVCRNPFPQDQGPMCQRHIMLEGRLSKDMGTTLEPISNVFVLCKGSC